MMLCDVKMGLTILITFVVAGILTSVFLYAIPIGTSTTIFKWWSFVTITFAVGMVILVVGEWIWNGRG